jgi:hypothetical protein
VTGCPQVANQGFGYVCSYLTTPPAAVAATTAATVFDRHFRLPVVQQGSLTLERTWRRGLTGSATYLMNLDRQLASSTDLNIAPSTANGTFQLQGGTGAIGVRNGEAFIVPVYSARLSPLFGPVTDIISNVNGTYNALLVTAEERARRGLLLRAHYTWAKAIDYGQNNSGTPRTNAEFDPGTVRYDKGLSSLNYPQTLHVEAVWEPNPAAGERLRRLAGGWSVAPIFNLRSGRPYTLQIFGGKSLAGGNESINGSGGATYLPTVGRNTLRLPVSSMLDLRVARSFGLVKREHLRLRVSAEAFNLLNRLNLSSVEQRAYLVGTPVLGVTPLIFQNAAEIAAEGINTPAFGTPTAAASSGSRERQVQLGMRLDF